MGNPPVDMGALRRERTPDVLRGLTCMGMFLVNTASNDAPGFLRHAGFAGPVSFADTIFPCFLFTSGLSGSTTPKPTKSLIRRAALLSGAGLLVNLAPRVVKPRGLLELSTYRIPGVLQRVGISSLVASLDFYVPLGVLPAALAAIWYGVSQRFAYSPKEPFACPPATAQSRIDLAVFGRSRLHQPGMAFDPEGLLGSILTAPMSISLGRMFRTGMVAATTYLTGLRQPRATLFPVRNPAADIERLPHTVNAILPTLGAGLSAICMARFASSVLGRLTPYPTPASKALWTPVFVGQTTAYSILYWAVADSLVAASRAQRLPPSLRKVLSFIVERVEALGRLSLEGYLLSCFASALLRAGGDSSVWNLVRKGLEARGVSGTLAGVGVSTFLSLAVVEATRLMESKGWKLR